MIREIKVNGQPVEVNTSLGWFIRYSETFGNDILPDILPLMEAIILGAIDLLEDTEDGLTITSILEGIRDGRFITAISMLAGLEMTTVLQIVWAMIKEADEDAPGFREWARRTEACYFDEIIPQLFWDISDTIISKKNMDRLRNALKEKSKANRENPEEIKTNTSASTPS